MEPFRREQLVELPVARLERLLLCISKESIIASCGGEVASGRRPQAPLYQLGKTEVQGQRGWEEQAGIGHQALMRSG